MLGEKCSVFYDSSIILSFRPQKTCGKHIINSSFLISDLNLGDTSNYSTEERNALFQQGQEHERNLKLNAALQCYLGCVQGLRNKNLFVHLPQCLQKVSTVDISVMVYLLFYCIPVDSASPLPFVL